MADSSGSSDEASASRAESAIVSLLAAARSMAPSELAASVSASARHLRATQAIIYRIDYHQTTLVPIPSEDAPDRGALNVEGTLAGKAFTNSRSYRGESSPNRGESPLTMEHLQGLATRLWVPLLNGAERLGVLELVFGHQGDTTRPEGWSGVDQEDCLSFADSVATLLITRGAFGDIDEYVRRRKPLTVPAELQWRMLPPLTFATDRLTISGVLEPCEAVAGDSFDYAVNSNRAHFAIFDAMGHGLGSTLLAGVATAAYRNGRRALKDLPDIHTGIDTVLADQFGGDRFVTGLLGELDLDRGLLRWTCAGHPPPLLLRGPNNVSLLEVDPEPPLGLRLGGQPVVCEAHLEPGDRIVCYSDGVVDARGPSRDFFGVERLADFVARASASGLDAAEVLRRLAVSVLDHVSFDLDDDATIVLVEWSGPPTG